MVASAKLSVAKGILSGEDALRLEKLLSAVGLPVRASAEKGKLLDAIMKDKKREGEKVNFVLLKGLGNAEVAEIGIDELERVLDDMC
jgi:3-dehydroquinate synthase